MILQEINYLKKEEKEYFGIKVRAFVCEDSLKHYPAFPWRFEIEKDGKLIGFYGIPNYVETKAKALKRAWYRAKWLSEGKFDKKYSNKYS